MSLPIPQLATYTRPASAPALGQPARAGGATNAYASQAARYRDAELAAATPGQLVVLLFDKILLTLRRARLAMEGRQIEERVELVLKASEMVTELRLSLDFEQGGAIATNLDALYAFALGQLFELNRTPDVAKVDAIVRIMSELRDAFAQIVGGAPSMPSSPLAGSAGAAPTLAARSA